MIPLIHCEFCQKEVDPKASGSYKRVLGWVQNRKQGGAHAVTLPSAPLAWACQNCIEIQKHEPVQQNAGSLF